MNSALTAPSPVIRSPVAIQRISREKRKPRGSVRASRTQYSVTISSLICGFGIRFLTGLFNLPAYHSHQALNERGKCEVI
jgi:hypothetical protein